MIYDTAGKPIYESIMTCNCGLTGGCSYCNPVKESFIGCITDEEAAKMKDTILRRKCAGHCVNCKAPLEPFCSRYCKVEYETPPLTP